MNFRNLQVSLSVVLVILLCGCVSVTASTSDNNTLDAPAFTSLPSTEDVQDIEETQTVSDQQTATGSESPAQSDNIPDTKPTADQRLSPEDWQTWPVIPTLSPAMHEVYQKGKSLGNRPDAFSKVGDCQIIPEVFLGIFDDINYSLPEDQEYLQDTLDHFSGSFAREGMALKGGFVFPTVFSPLLADSSVCDPGETPFECELKVHQPSFVLISMEFRYDGRTVETHEKYMRQAVEYAISRGIVPIVATKADNFEGDHSLNRMTAQIAYEYDLPLWNYWRAVQILPEHGIDWERDSYGFHVTPTAWMVRNMTFLKTLDVLWHDTQ